MAVKNVLSVAVLLMVPVLVLTACTALSNIPGGAYKQSGCMNSSSDVSHRISSSFAVVRSAGIAFSCRSITMVFTI